MRYKYNSGYGTVAQIDSWITAGTLYQTTNVQEGGVVAIYEYDRYSSGPSLSFQTVSGLSLSADQSRVKGLKTYEKVYNTDNVTYAERRFYYDSKARLIQTVERNHLGYISRYSYEYDFMSNTITDHESHQVSASTIHTMLKRKTYDHRNRLLSTTTTLNNGTPATVTYAYNELGQLQTKKLGNVSTITNQYNIQGWLTSQSSPKFSLGLDYFSAGKRDGNITKLSWGQSLVTDQYYTLDYDIFGRLISGVHSLGKFNETIGGYDLNGNIKSLTRTANGSTSDNFTYTYSGNRLTNLSGITGTYTYDDSGNLTNDPRKSLNITWNSLNLPKEVKSGSTVKAQYLYSYDGVKVRVQDSGNTNGYDYLGSLTLVKTNNTLTPEYNFGEGMIKGNEVMYFEKDHLGSIRSVLNTSGTVLEKNDYYPFGLRHANSSYVVTANNRFKFNGKEDQTVGALGLLDYGARMYDGQIGRWLSMDPLAEKYYSTSPYVYCVNNPINYFDPDGKRGIPVRPPVRRGYRNGGRPNPYAFYPRGVKPQSYVQTTNLSYTGNGLRETVPMAPQSYIETLNTPGGNKIQFSSNNRFGQGITGLVELTDTRNEFRKKLASLVTTVNYGKNGVIQRNTELVINDPYLALQQLNYEAQAAKIEEELGELDFTGKLLMEIIEMSAERKSIIQEKLGISPKNSIMIEFFTNPNSFQATQQERRILPEFIQQ